MHVTAFKVAAVDQAARLGTHAYTLLHNSMLRNSCSAVNLFGELVTASVLNFQDKEEAEHALEKTQCQLETCKASFHRETAALQTQVRYCTDRTCLDTLIKISTA